MSAKQFITSMLRGLSVHWAYLFRSEKRTKPVVERYPDAVSGRSSEDLSTNFKGYLRNDLTKCSGCGDCIPLCPVAALTLEKRNNESGVESARSFSIDLGKCFSCGLCVDECPEQSLQFTRAFELAPKSKSDLLVVHKKELGPSEKLTVRIRTYEVRR